MNSALPRMPKSKTEHVAQRLLDKIIEAGLAPGSSFGTEAELLEQFGVSRPTLRESLRILESQGVLELRPGPGGGIMVKKPSIDILARGLSVFLRLHEVPFITVLKTREVIEPALAAEAAANGTEEDFDDMQASIDRMKAAGQRKRGHGDFLGDDQRARCRRARRPEVHPGQHVPHRRSAPVDPGCLPG